MFCISIFNLSLSQLHLQTSENLGISLPTLRTKKFLLKGSTCMPVSLMKKIKTSRSLVAPFQATKSFQKLVWKGATRLLLIFGYHRLTTVLLLQCPVLLKRPWQTQVTFPVSFLVLHTCYYLTECSSISDTFLNLTILMLCAVAILRQLVLEAYFYLWPDPMYIYLVADRLLTHIFIQK